MDSEREHEGQKGCRVSHSSDAAVQRLTTSECGSERFLLPFDNQNIFVASLHVHQGGSEPLYITKLIHALQYTVEKEGLVLMVRLAVKDDKEMSLSQQDSCQ